MYSPNQQSREPVGEQNMMQLWKNDLNQAAATSRIVAAIEQRALAPTRYANHYLIVGPEMPWIFPLLKQGPHPIHDSLGPPESATGTASRLLEPL